MNAQNQELNGKQSWVEPEIRELDVRETAVAPHLGADAGGNPCPDSQHS